MSYEVKSTKAEEVKTGEKCECGGMCTCDLKIDGYVNGIQGLLSPEILARAVTDKIKELIESENGTVEIKTPICYSSKVFTNENGMLLCINLSSTDDLVKLAIANYIRNFTSNYREIAIAGVSEEVQSLMESVAKTASDVAECDDTSELSRRIFENFTGDKLH